MDVNRAPKKCVSVGIQGLTWAFGGMILALAYCTAGTSGGHINPAVTFGLLLARKLSLTRAVFYMIMQCLGAICGAGVVKGFESKPYIYEMLGGGANVVNHGYTKGDCLGAEIIGTFVLVTLSFLLLMPKEMPETPMSLFWHHYPLGLQFFGTLATILIIGTGINPARSLGAAIICNKRHAWDDQWIFWVGPFIGAALAAVYPQIIIRALPFKAMS